jgi:hypothetical protein
LRAAPLGGISHRGHRASELAVISSSFRAIAKGQDISLTRHQQLKISTPGKCLGVPARIPWWYRWRRKVRLSPEGQAFAGRSAGKVISTSLIDGLKSRPLLVMNRCAPMVTAVARWTASAAGSL